MGVDQAEVVRQQTLGAALSEEHAVALARAVLQLVSHNPA
jgi:hypothetical protein